MEKPPNATTCNGYWICEDNTAMTGASTKSPVYNLFDAVEGWFGFGFKTMDDAKVQCEALAPGTLE